MADFLDLPFGGEEKTDPIVCAVVPQRTGGARPGQGSAIHLVFSRSEATENTLVDFPFGPAIHTANIQRHYKRTSADYQLRQRNVVKSASCG